MKLKGLERKYLIWNLERVEAFGQILAKAVQSQCIRSNGKDSID